MNLCVSDKNVIVNTQSVRYVTWGESAYTNTSIRPWFLSVAYKGNRQYFYYETEAEARAIFEKVREAMDKTAAQHKQT